MEGKECTQKFEGSNVQECLKNASVSLGVSREKIKYLVLEEKKGLFKKHAVISIDVTEGLDNKYILKEKVSTKEEIFAKEQYKKMDSKNSDGTIEIKQGVITLDIEMPKMNGMETLKQLKRININVPVIMLSSISKLGTESTMDCLELGAFDFIAKPSGEILLDLNKVKDELVQKIKIAFMQNRSEISLTNEKGIKANRKIAHKIATRVETGKKNNIEAVVIGASTGGPKALYEVITGLPSDIGVPVLVVQHMPVGFTKAFAERLNLNSELKVIEASDGDLIEKNIVYIAPGGYHMEIGSNKRIHLNIEPTVWGVRPAVDKLFLSASKVYGAHLLSVVLTGMGRDGARGTAEIKDNGGITIAEHESSCIIYGMPKAAFETGKVDEVVLLANVAQQIKKIVMGR